MGNSFTSETNSVDDVIFEIVENNPDKQLKIDNSILQNDLIFKNKDLSNKILEIKNTSKENKKLKETISELEYKINIKDNNNKIKLHEINDLKEKYDELEYNKLDIEEKYLNMLDYKDNFENCKQLNNKLEEELKLYIVKDNDNLNKIDILKNNINESIKYKKNYDKLFQEHNILKINFDKLKKEHNKILTDNSLLINDVSHKLNNINLKKTIYDYLDNKLKKEPYINNIICDDIINIFKNQISSLKLKYI